MYIDGRADGNKEITLSGDFSNALDLRFGSRGSEDYFNGGLDEIRIYNYARTPAQVAWDYNKGKPIAHYILDECQGYTIHDASGNGLHGLLNLGESGETSTGACDNLGAWSLGKSGRYNSGMSFDGVDDYISVPDSDFFDFRHSDFTLTAWIKKVGDKSSPGIIAKNNSSGGYKLVMDQNGLRFGIYYQTWYYYYGKDDVIDLLDGDWHQVVAVIDRDENVSFYIDGQFISAHDITDTASIDLNSTSSLRIGDDNFCRSSYCGYFDGHIDDVQIFNYALTEEQVKVLHNGGAVRWE